MNNNYCKVAFSSSRGMTAGLIFTREQMAQCANVEGISRKFPMSEAMKMERIHISPWFDTFESAFAYQFTEGDESLARKEVWR